MTPADIPGRRVGAASRLLLSAALLLAAVACLRGAENPTGSGACAASARYPNAIGCAYVYGKVTGSRGQSLDSIEGSVRLSDACACSSPRIDGDDNGVYAVIVHRLPRPEGFADTATGTIVVLAAAPKYPRHVTGAAYFDTLRLVLRFAPIGAVPPPAEVNLRIPVPPA